MATPFNEIKDSVLIQEPGLGTFLTEGAPTAAILFGSGVIIFVFVCLNGLDDDRKPRDAHIVHGGHDDVEVLIREAVAGMGRGVEHFNRPAPTVV